MIRKIYSEGCGGKKKRKTTTRKPKSMRERVDSNQVVGYSPYFEQDITMDDFFLTITNEESIYRQIISPTINNLARKMKRKTYDATLALKAWENVADFAVKWYDKEYGSGRGSLTFMSKPMRKQVAELLMDRYTEDVEYEVNESVKSRKTESLLKEGPGAGYTIKFDSINVITINSAELKTVTDEQDYVIECDVDVTFDGVTANSYYYGTPEAMDDVDGKVTEVVFTDWYGYYDGKTNISKSDIESMIREALGSVEDKEYNYGGGWSHSAYDGTIGDVEDNGYFTGKITDWIIKDYIDDAVTGEIYITEYNIVADNETIDGSDDYDISDESDAIRHAEQLFETGNYDEVIVVRDEYVRYVSGDIDLQNGEVVWSSDSIADEWDEDEWDEDED